ncbi:hypothetical protein HPB50_009670 [Hyalomma asiaticum]|uniref:Uncharacterized protein n=1 Tax=Hyalomma asiaticum TaxID=266040 RepID=A0ACB7RJ32_HYAAI|nr:hypothetical protein HPB50_009670 [Hyalomma asiaticum]
MRCPLMSQGGPRVSDSQLEMVLGFMEQHPQLAQKSGELQRGWTTAHRRRLWQQLADSVNAEGPVTKTVEQWQDWWQKKVHDAAAVAEAQRCTGRGQAPGFLGRVLQGTGTTRVGGLQVGLPYQEVSCCFFFLVIVFSSFFVCLFHLHLD